MVVDVIELGPTTIVTLTGLEPSLPVSLPTPTSVTELAETVAV